MARVEYTAVSDLVRAFGRLPESLRKELRPQLRDASRHIVTDMKGRASYSRRIPRAIRMTVAFSGKKTGVNIRVSAKQAPHARVLERGNAGRHSTQFRHPVFGNKDVWVSQARRPFFFPAITAGRDRVRRNISDAVRASLREVK